MRASVLPLIRYTSSAQKLVEVFVCFKLVSGLVTLLQTSDIGSSGSKSNSPESYGFQ